MAMFIIPSPKLSDVLNEISLQQKLKCQCGLVMAYDIEQAGSICQCPKCSAMFTIPGGTQAAIHEALMSEQRPIRSAALPERPTEFQGTNRQLVERDLERASRELRRERASYEKLGFEKLFVAIALFFFVFIGLGVGLMYYTDRLELPNNWTSNATDTNDNDSKTATNIQQNTASQSKPATGTNSHPGEGSLRWVTIGPRIRTSNPIVPVGIEKPFEAKPLTESEVADLSSKVVAAIQQNSSQQMLDLMDIEVLGNYVFANKSLDFSQRYILGSDVFDYIKNNPCVTTGTLLETQYFGTKKVNNEFMGFVRVSSFQRFQFKGPRGTFSREPGIRSIQAEFQEAFEQYQSRFPASIENILPRLANSSFRDLLDRGLGYYAIVGTRSRVGKPVLLDIYCLNAPDCLFDTTWNGIQRDNASKSFDDSRPTNKSNEYREKLINGLGPQTTENLAIINFAYSSSGLPTTRYNNVSDPTSPASAAPVEDDCLDALEDMMKVFPDDRFNWMLQAAIASKAGFEEERKTLEQKAIEAGCPFDFFYQRLMDRNSQLRDEKEVKKILEGFRRNVK